MAEGELYPQENPSFLFLVFAEKTYSKGGGPESAEAVGAGEFKNTKGNRTFDADVSSGGSGVLQESSQKGVWSCLFQFIGENPRNGGIRA